MNDTIVAISTPPGRGGIGIVRLSGPQAKAAASAMLVLRQPLTHATARLAAIVDDSSPPRTLDQAVVTWFAAPHSYTTEDVIEIAAHGSPVVLEYIVRHALVHGARLARAGEFTERAFLNGRIDLTQAEAVHDLIDAQTIVQARIAAEQMGGALSRRIAPVKEQLVALIATLEAGIDFAEDDIDVMPANQIAERIASIHLALSPIAASYVQGRLVHSGFTLAIVGRPNAGKSSLFNCLVEREKAIVTPIAGTTRDAVTERIAIGGIPVELIDTAGLRETADLVESIGIGKTREAIAEADLVLVVLDIAVAGANPSALVLDPLEQALLHDLAHRNAIVILNKTDLLTAAQSVHAQQKLLQVLPGTSPRVSPVSAQTGEGIAALREQVLAAMQAANPSEQSGMLTTLRHQLAISDAQQALLAAQEAVAAAIPHEMLLLDLYKALEALDSLTGITTNAQILERIFSTFCIGK